MKISQSNDDIMEVQTGPKLRNIHDEAEVPEEKPEGADIRLRIAVAAIAALTLFIGIKGFITKSRLVDQLEEQKSLYTQAHAEALLYGIVEDEDGDLIIPDISTGSVNASDLDWDSLDVRNETLLNEFAGLLLNWGGTSEYNKVRQTLIDEWGFKENSKLLSSFMPELDEELTANISLQGKPTIYLLDTNGKDMSYFLICTVRNTINSRSAVGLVGIQITINEDGTISNTMAQTLE